MSIKKCAMMVYFYSRSMVMDKFLNVKIVFIDIDGTLVNNRKRVTLKTRKAIRGLVCRGIYVVLTTGRNAFHTIDKSRRALASSIIISSNGSEIYDYKNKKTIYIDEIDNDKILEMWRFCNLNKVGVLINSLDGKYINKYLIGKDKENSILITNEKELKKITISQVVLISNNLENMMKTKEFINKIGLCITSYSESFLDNTISDRYRLDINNKGVSKGKAIKILLNELNIKKEESLCFGDYYNDIDMFMECGIKVAMGNACDDLKKISDYVTLSNEENGVAEFINKYL